MSRWLVFGASGFVGRALTPLLEQSDIAHAALSSKDIDLTSPDSVGHIAALFKDGDSILLLSGYTPERGKAEDIAIKNLSMVQHILAAIKGRALGHFIYMSSDAVYPLSADVVDEHTPACPNNPYGQSHLMRERFLQDHIAPEKLAILRPCAIYGEGDSHNSYGVSRFIRSAQAQGEIILFGGGEEFRDHVHVDDVAHIVAASQQLRTPGIFNIASGKSWRFIEIAQYIQNNMNKKIEIVHKPRSVPILHRHANILKLCSAFPELKPRAIDTGINELLK